MVQRMVIAAVKDVPDQLVRGIAELVGVESDEDELDNEGYMKHIDEETKENICNFDNFNIDFKMPEINKSLMSKKIDVEIKIV